MHGIKREVDETLVGLLQNAGVQKRVHVAMNRIHVSPPDLRAAPLILLVNGSFHGFRVSQRDMTNCSEKSWQAAFRLAHGLEWLRAARPKADVSSTRGLDADASRQE